MRVSSDDVVSLSLEVDEGRGSMYTFHSFDLHFQNSGTSASVRRDDNKGCKRSSYPPRKDSRYGLPRVLVSAVGTKVGVLVRFDVGLGSKTNKNI